MRRDRTADDAPAPSWRFASHGAVLAALALTLAGCATALPPPAAPTAPLTLLDAGRLELPRECIPERGAVYRTRFVVETDGSVSQAMPESGDGCVQRALQRWVSTFRYERVQVSTPTVYDWILVSATRGG